MAFNVQEFRASLLYDGARPSLFDVSMTVPALVAFEGVNRQITFRAKATELPGDSINPISLNYFGREIKVAGVHSFNDWSITVINDEDFTIRNTFERWMSAINSHVGNVRAPQFIRGDGGYQCDAFVTQYSKTGGGVGAAGVAGITGGTGIIKDYGMIGCFPTEIAPIQLDWGSNAEVEEFQVTFSYQWWETYAPNPTTDTGTGNIAQPGAGFATS